MKKFLLFNILLLSGIILSAQNNIDSLFPVRSVSIGVPSPSKIDSFIRFIRNEMVPRKVNNLVLRVDYNYAYTSHPELVGPNVLTRENAKKILSVCKENGIQIVPLVNLFGHQSWASKAGKLLEVYPQFDETPGIKLPAEYKWPNEDSLYCKSYCPLHPDVHNVVFDLADEICEVFEATAFHAGMDEVFYIADKNCPRCKGKDRSELFAGEVNKIRDHLAKKNRRLWIWGDRLIEGNVSGLGIWEASGNDTHRAIDMVKKDVVICDWHYERPDKTAYYFAMKGFDVITGTWRDPGLARIQSKDMMDFRSQATPVMRPRFLGMMHTVWSPADSFMSDYYKNVATTPFDQDETFRSLFAEMIKLAAK
jgi:N-acetyl-beta-hexosaminidase